MPSSHGIDIVDNEPLHYEELHARFSERLMTSLRGHEVGFAFLEMWVPDEDPVKSILNMVESAEMSGADSLTVSVSRVTLPAERDADLLAQLDGLGVVTVVADETNALVRITGIGIPSALADIAPALRDGVVRRLATIRHEGDLPDSVGSLIRLTAEAGTATLSVLIDPTDGHRIRDARHGGADPVERAVLDVLCESVIGTPIDDAAGHGPIRALARLLDPGQPRPVAGILHPINAHPAFQPALRMVQALRDSYAAQVGPMPRYNEFDTPPAAGWLELGDHERLARVKVAVATGFAEAEWSSVGLEVLRIDTDNHGHPVRIVVSFAQGVDSNDKPELMRSVEKILKIRVERKLQIFLEQLKDENMIRRL
jgi:hypothetical protein